MPPQGPPSPSKSVHVFLGGLPARAQYWEPQAAVLWFFAGPCFDLGVLVMVRMVEYMWRNEACERH